MFREIYTSVKKVKIKREIYHIQEKIHIPIPVCTLAIYTKEKQHSRIKLTFYAVLLFGISQVAP